MLAALLLVACGRIGFADLDQDAITDAAVDATCSFGPWTAPVHLAAVSSTATDWAPTISPDGLSLVFISTRTGNAQLFEASRASPSDPFGPPVELTALNSPGVESSPTFAADGLALYFNAPSGLSCARRASTTEPFGAPALVPVNGGVGTFGVAVSADELELFSGYPDISRATREVGADFAYVGLQSELSPGGYPSLSGDDLTIYFVSDRGGRFEIFNATRAARDQQFATPMRVEMLSADGDSDDPEISTDGTTIVFASTRTGNYDLFMSTRSCL